MNNARLQNVRRYSLGSLLVLITVAALWLGYRGVIARSQREIVDAIVRRGGTVEYDFESDELGLPLRMSRSPIPKWLISIAGIDFFHNVTTARYWDASATDEDLRILSRLPALEHLFLARLQVTDHGLSVLENVRLRNLVMVENKTPLNRSAVENIARIDSLTGLRLYLTGASDADFSPLQNLSSLELLEIHNNQSLNGNFLRYLASLPQLRHVSVFDTGVEDASLAYLQGASSISYLNLGMTKVSDDVLPYLARLPNLKAVQLSKTSVTAKAAQEFYNTGTYDSVRHSNDTECTGATPSR